MYIRVVSWSGLGGTPARLRRALRLVALAILGLPRASPGLAALAEMQPPHIAAAQPLTGQPGDRVAVNGGGFGAEPGWVLLAGRRIEADYWSDRLVRFTLPEDAASGPVWLRTADNAASDALDFTVRRPFPAGQFPPHALHLDETGLLGAAFLVETDGDYLYGICGFETLSTYRISASGPYSFCSRAYLPQRVADIRLEAGYLFCAGDHGLTIYRCADLQIGATQPAATATGASYAAVDVRPAADSPGSGSVVALCEYAPRAPATSLRVQLYRFEAGELTPLGSLRREAGPDERQHAIALDPLHPRAFVSGSRTLLGNDKYVLELDISDPARLVVSYIEETAGVLLFDMEAAGDLLWAGLSSTGTAFFRLYRLAPPPGHLALERTVQGTFGLGRTTRVRIIDSRFTAGCAWSGARPDVFLMRTSDPGPAPLAASSSLDWAFDVTGFSHRSGRNPASIIVADEWGGFITYEITGGDAPALTHQPDYRWVVGAAMTEGLHLAAGRLYIAGRGAGAWSADPAALADEPSWRRPAWDWTQPAPQPYPISAVCTRIDRQHGMLIAALGHEKAMAWGQRIIGILYAETPAAISELAVSEEIDPPGAFSSGISAVWPERDLVYMTTGADGFRAFVVDPTAPSIALHRGCREQGFGRESFGTANAANCMRHLTSSDGQKRLIIGSTPALLVADPTLHVYDLDYPQGVPHRIDPDRPISVTRESALNCLAYKTVYHLDVRPSGLIAAATSQGMALFHLSWIEQLNQLPDFQAWNLIRIPPAAYAPWWDDRWPPLFGDVCFAHDNALYAVKPTRGVWRLQFEIDPGTMSHRSAATGYYPGVECGMDYNQLLHGWANSDIPTLHHPYGAVADGDTVFVTGWSGKVERLTYHEGDAVVIEGIAASRDEVLLRFSSPFTDRPFHVEAADSLTDAQWTPQPDAAIMPLATGQLLARFPTAPQPPQQYYRISVHILPE